MRAEIPAASSTLSRLLLCKTTHFPYFDIFFIYRSIWLKQQTKTQLCDLEKNLSFWSPWSHLCWTWESEVIWHWGGKDKFVGNSHYQWQVALSSIFTNLDTNKNSVFLFSTLTPSSEPHRSHQQNKNWQEQNVSLSPHGKHQSRNFSVCHCTLVC